MSSRTCAQSSPELPQTQGLLIHDLLQGILRLSTSRVGSHIDCNEAREETVLDRCGKRCEPRIADFIQAEPELLQPQHLLALQRVCESDEPCVADAILVNKQAL